MKFTPTPTATPPRHTPRPPNAPTQRYAAFHKILQLSPQDGSIVKRQIDAKYRTNVQTERCAHPALNKGRFMHHFPARVEHVAGLMTSAKSTKRRPGRKKALYMGRGPTPVPLHIGAHAMAQSAANHPRCTHSAMEGPGSLAERTIRTAHSPKTMIVQRKREAAGIVDDSYQFRHPQSRSPPAADTIWHNLDRWLASTWGAQSSSIPSGLRNCPTMTALKSASGPVNDASNWSMQL